VLLLVAQLGTDLQRLESALSHIQQLCQQLSDEQPEFNPPQLLGSVFLPSRRLLAQMKFRCVVLPSMLGFSL